MQKPIEKTLETKTYSFSKIKGYCPLPYFFCRRKPGVLACIARLILDDSGMALEISESNDSTLTLYILSHVLHQTTIK